MLWVSWLLAGIVRDRCELPPSGRGLFVSFICRGGGGEGKKLEKLSRFWRRRLLGTWSQESGNFWAFEKNVQLGGGGDGVSSEAAPLLRPLPAPAPPGSLTSLATSTWQKSKSVCV